MSFLDRYERFFVVVLVLAYIVLALGYSSGPLFEGPDELQHYGYIRILVEQRKLPTVEIIEAYQGGNWGELHQPVLYYALMTPLAALIPEDTYSNYVDRLNPFYGYRFEIPGNDNKNIYLHPRAEQFPYDDAKVAQAVHLIRLLSIVFGTCTAIAAYSVFVMLWPERVDRRLVALGAVVFMPQFVYVTSVVSNDSLSFLWITLALYLTLRQIRYGPTWQNAAALGVVLGLAFLTKLNVGFMVLPLGLAALMNRRAWRYAPLTLGLITLIAGWWYIRNMVLFDDPTAVNVLFEYSAPTEKIRDGGLHLDIGMESVRFAYDTFWARFGPGSVAVHETIYDFFDALVVFVLVGVGLQLVGASKRALNHEWNAVDLRQSVVMAAFMATWIIAVIYWSSRVWSGNQGRFLLPGIAGWAALIAYGLGGWVPRRFYAGAGAATVILLGVIAGVCLFGYFTPAYRPSSVPDSIEKPLSYTYDGYAELIGMAPKNLEARPGDTIRITLYWRALSPTETNLYTYIHSIETLVVRRESIPATGNLLSTDWEPGQEWAEHYVVKIPDDATAPITDLLIAGLYDPQAGYTLPATDANGNTVTPLIGSITITPAD